MLTVWQYVPNFLLLPATFWKGSSTLNPPCEEASAGYLPALPWFLCLPPPPD